MQSIAITTNALITRWYEKWQLSRWGMISGILVIMIGRMLFLYVFVQAVILFRIYYEVSRHTIGQVRQLHEFMEYRELPPSHRQRLVSYFKFCFTKLYFRENRVLGFITGILREDILMYRCQQMVANVDFLKNLPIHVMVRIVVRLSSHIYLANEVVIKAGTHGSSMYFISSGTVVIYSGSGNEITHLYDGAHFGEIALLSGEQTRIASVVAIETCELYVLRRDAFLEAVAFYPDLLRQLEETAYERLDQTVALDRKSRRFTSMNRGDRASKLSNATASTSNITISSGIPTDSIVPEHGLTEEQHLRTVNPDSSDREPMDRPDDSEPSSGGTGREDEMQ